MCIVDELRKCGADLRAVSLFRYNRSVRYPGALNRQNCTLGPARRRQNPQSTPETRSAALVWSRMGWVGCPRVAGVTGGGCAAGRATWQSGLKFVSWVDFCDLVSRGAPARASPRDHRAPHPSHPRPNKSRRTRFRRRLGVLGSPRVPFRADIGGFHAKIGRIAP